MLLPHTIEKLYTAEIAKSCKDVGLSHGAVRFSALYSNRTSSYSFACDKTAKDDIVGSQKKVSAPYRRSLKQITHRITG